MLLHYLGFGTRILSYGDFKICALGYDECDEMTEKADVMV